MLTLCFSAPQHRVHLVAERGVALVGHRLRTEAHRLGVSLHPAVVGRSRARAVGHLLVHAVGLQQRERQRERRKETERERGRDG